MGEGHYEYTGKVDFDPQTGKMKPRETTTPTPDDLAETSKKTGREGTQMAPHELLKDQQDEQGAESK